MAHKPNLTKKEARVHIRTALASLTNLKSVLGEKKFNRRIEKAEKILAGGLPKKKKKENAVDAAVETVITVG